MAKPNQIVWLERPGETVAALYNYDTQKFTHLSSKQIYKHAWVGSKFIGRLIKFEPQLDAWFVDVGSSTGQDLPALVQDLLALVPAKPMAYYAKHQKLKLTEGLYAPFTVTADAHDGKGPRLQPVLEVCSKSDRAKGPRCVHDLSDPVERLRQTHKLEATQVSPFKQPELYTALSMAWAEAVEPVINFMNGSLKIEPTAAVTCIDVNGAGHATTLNTAACQGIADAVFSRNIGGQILIDFASMQTKQDRNLILETLQSAFGDDTHKLQWGGVDGFSCLMFSRQKIGPSVYEQIMEPAQNLETGLKLPPQRQLIGFLDQLYRHKMQESDWAKRKSLSLEVPSIYDMDFVQKLEVWMAENAFIDLKIQTSEQTPQPEIRLL